MLNEKIKSAGWFVSIAQGLPNTVEELKIRKSLMEQVILKIDEGEKMNKAKNPVNIYISKCCNAQADKEPCERTKEEVAEKKFGEASLGTWRCPRCGKKCKVVPQKNPDYKVKP